MKSQASSPQTHHSCLWEKKWGKGEPRLRFWLERQTTIPYLALFSGAHHETPRLCFSGTAWTSTPGITCKACQAAWHCAASWGHEVFCNVRLLWFGVLNCYKHLYSIVWPGIRLFQNSRARVFPGCHSVVFTVAQWHSGRQKQALDDLHAPFVSGVRKLSRRACRYKTWG